MNAIKRFFSEAFLSQKGRSAAFAAEEFVLFEIAYPLVTMIFYCLLASFSFGTVRLERWVIGNSFLLCTNACVFGTGRVFATERYNGRLRSIIASPCNKFAVLLSNGVFPMLFALCAAVLGMLAGSLLFHADFSGVNLALVAVAAVCAMISATGFGLLLASVCLISDSMHLILNIAAFLLMIFTGTEFPVERLPFAGQVFAWMMPLTKSVRATHLLLDGDSASYAPLVCAELLTALALVLLSFLILRFAETAARKNGRFDLF